MGVPKWGSFNDTTSQNAHHLPYSTCSTTALFGHRVTATPKLKISKQGGDETQGFKT